jgi:para-nitrobenzyl esterase
LLGAGSLAEMRRRPVSELLAADLKLSDASLVTSDFRWLRSTIDGAVLPDAPRALLAKAPKRPVIVGSNRAEFAPGPGGVDWDRELAATFKGNARAAREFYRGTDPRLGTPEMQYWTDWIFRCPAGRVADLLSARGADVWRYEFDLARGGGMTSHNAELAYLFDDIRFPSGDLEVSLQEYWVVFAKTGEPNSGTQPWWPRYTPKAPVHLLFDARGASRQTGLRPEICSKLEEL